MKNKTGKIISVMSVILLCAVLMTNLYACKPDNGNDSGKKDNDVENTSNKTGGDSDNPYENMEPPEVFFTSKEIADAVLEVFSPDDFPVSFERRFSGADEKSDDYLSPERAGYLVTGMGKPIEEFDYLEDYAFCEAGARAFEVSVLRIKKGEEANIDAVKEILNKKLQRKDIANMQNYNPQDVPLVENAKIMTVANYAILIITTDNKKAEDVINNMIYGDGEILENNGGEENPAQPGENTPDPSVSLDGVVDIEPEILFDFSILKNIESSTQNPADPNERRTTLPRVTVKQHSHNASFLIGGKCEIGAMIRVTGGTQEYYTGSDHGDFLVEIPFSEDGVSTLMLTVESEGKSPSEEITFVVKPRTDINYYEDAGNMGVVVGYNFTNYFDDCMPDYTGENLLTESGIEEIKTKTESKIRSLRNNGCNAEIIYLIAPNTVRIWPENVPERYIQYTGDTLFNQWKSGVTAGGATVIDLHDIFIAHKNDEFKIWNKTDSHWTEYGAYLAYVELMNHIAEKFPDAAPRPASDFEFYNQEMNFGDIYPRLGLSVRDLKETSTFANFNFDPPRFNPDYRKGHLGMDLYKSGTLDINHDTVAFAHVTNSDEPGNLPSAYFLRDSYEGPLHAFYTDRFSTAAFQSMWSYWLDESAVGNADYVIYVVGERNLKALLN